MGNTSRKYHKEPRTKRQFIKELYPVAVETSTRLKQRGYALSPITILAMAALESSWGEDVKGNMYFEKKADWNAPSATKQLLLRRRLHNHPHYTNYPKTVKIIPLADGQYKYIVKEWFMKYDNPLHNFIHHFTDMICNEQYKEAFELGINGKLFFQKLEEAGYTFMKRYYKEDKYATKAIWCMQMIDRNIDLPSFNLVHSPLVETPHTPHESYPSSVTYKE